eukprot:jgi/Tetstr1/437982/TSEL_026612.t1
MIFAAASAEAGGAAGAVGQTAASDAVELNATLARLKQHLKKAGGIIKHNTNAVKTMAATQAFPGDNVDEGSFPEPLAKKTKQPAKPAA